MAGGAGGGRVSGPPVLADLRKELADGLASAFAETVGAEAGIAREAALSVLDGRGLPGPFAAHAGDRPVCSLVAFDADRIQGWVFASERVQVAKGASETLMYLQLHAGTMVEAHRGLLHGVVTAAGGGGILVASGRRPAAEIEAAVRGWLEGLSRELTFTVVAEPLGARDLAPGGARTELGPGGAAALDRFALVSGLPGALTRLQIRVRQAKDARPRLGGTPPTWEARPGTALARCPSCGRRPRGAAPPPEDGPDAWCGWCAGFRDIQRDNLYVRHQRWITFSELAEAAVRRRKYLGFVSIDGNGMGDLAQRMGTLLELRAWSETTTAIYEGARREVERVLGGGDLLAPDWKPQEASLSFLSGGDEITVALPAAAAPQAAAAVLRAIEAGYDRATSPGGLLAEAFRDESCLLERMRAAGAAAGIVLAAPHYPVRLLRRYAEALQKEAKQAPGRSGVAWALLTDSSPLPESPEMGHAADLGLGGFENFLADVAAAVEARVPSSALHQLVEHARAEEASIRVLGKPDLDEVVGLLAANFFRYQLARSRELAAFWRAVETRRGGASGPDPVATWFRRGGARRIAGLSEILSLDPVTEVRP
jgi:hypothetical protein